MPSLRKVKHETFAVLCSQGIKVTEAYVRAGYKQSPYVPQNANKVFNHPEVQARIEELKEINYKANAERFELNRNKLLLELGKIIYGQASDRDKISAIQVAAKLMGLEINLNANINMEAKAPSNMNLEQLKIHILALKAKNEQV